MKFRYVIQISFSTAPIYILQLEMISVRRNHTGDSSCVAHQRMKHVAWRERYATCIQVNVWKAIPRSNSNIWQPARRLRHITQQWSLSTVQAPRSTAALSNRKPALAGRSVATAAFRTAIKETHCICTICFNIKPLCVLPIQCINVSVRGLRLRWSRGSVLAFGTQVRGFKPDRSRWIFQDEKILSMPSFGGEVKPSVPFRRITACKRYLNVTWKSGIFRQNSSTISRPCSSSFGC